MSVPSGEYLYQGQKVTVKRGSTKTSRIMLPDGTDKTVPNEELLPVTPGTVQASEQVENPVAPPAPEPEPTPAPEPEPTPAPEPEPTPAPIMETSETGPLPDSIMEVRAEVPETEPEVVAVEAIPVPPPVIRGRKLAHLTNIVEVHQPTKGPKLRPINVN